MRGDESRLHDTVYVVPPEGHRGWILDGICGEVARRRTGRQEFVNTYPLSPARAYFFSHYTLFVRSAQNDPCIWGGQRVVFFTHKRESGISDDELAFALNRATVVVTMNTEAKVQLEQIGVKPRKLVVALAGADPARFHPHERGRGDIGFCSAFYPRKDPDRILGIIKALPHRKFRLLGKNWEKYDRFSEMRGLPNLTYLEFPYSEYPSFYDRIDVFVSVAQLEGGPIPLIEAMMSNAVPVATRTGFAPDLISHGSNGYIVDVDASVEEICHHIERAQQLDGNIRQSVEHLTWDRFADQISDYLGANAY